MKYFAVGVFNDSGECLSVFDGKEYTQNVDNIKLFPASQKQAARVEAGSHQSRNESVNEVRVLVVDVPEFVTIELPEKVPEITPVNDTLLAE